IPQGGPPGSPRVPQGSPKGVPPKDPQRGSHKGAPQYRQTIFTIISCSYDCQFFSFAVVKTADDGE
ncbi:hypothetical protein L9F63_024723, partial [Diploptera punctata]